MLARITIGNKLVSVDFSKPLDISIPIREGTDNVNAFNIPPVKFEPFRSGDFIGDVSKGGSCNVFSIFFNPHGNGTHTETVGHIAKEKFPIYKYLKKFFFEARLISVKPEKFENDSIIKMSQLKRILNDSCPEALIIRTLPNPSSKIN